MWPIPACWEVSDLTWAGHDHSVSASGSVTASWGAPSFCLPGTDIPPAHSTAPNCSSSQRKTHGLLQAQPKAPVLALVYFLKTPSITIKCHFSWTFQNRGAISHEEWNLFFQWRYFFYFVLGSLAEPLQHKKKIHTECSYSLRSQLSANKFPFCLCVCVFTNAESQLLSINFQFCCKLKDQQNLAAIY